MPKTKLSHYDNLTYKIGDWLLDHDRLWFFISTLRYNRNRKGLKCLLGKHEWNLRTPILQDGEDAWCENCPKVRNIKGEIYLGDI